MMWFSGASLVTLLSLGALLPAAAQTPLSAALKEIRETAADICATVEQKGQKSNLQLSGEVQAKVAGVSAKLADLGVKSSGEISSQEYQGVSQEVLATALSDIRTCRQHVFDKLLDKMIVSAYASVPPPSTSQSASRVVLPSRLFAAHINIRR